jgi:hypothetical protein
MEINEARFQELLKRSDDGVISYGGTTYKLDPSSNSVVVVGGGVGGVDFPFAPANDKYGEVLFNLMENTDPTSAEIGRDMYDASIAPAIPVPREITPSMLYDPESLPPSRYAGGTDPKEEPLTLEQKQTIARIGNKQALEAATLKERQKAQRRDLAGKLGPAAILGGIDLAVQLLSKGEDEKYVDEELARLRKMQEDDEMGLSAEEKQFLVQAQMSPARGFAREERMRREAGEATMGGQISAADLERSRRAAQQGVAEVGRQAGMTIAQADMAKADQNLKRMEQMIAYKGARQKQKRAAVSSFAGALGAIYGDVAATGAVKPDTGTIRGIYGEAAKQGKLLSADEATKLMRRLRYSPRMNEQKVRDIFADAGLENVSDDFIASITKGSA